MMYLYLCCILSAGIGLFWYTHRRKLEEIIRIQVYNHRLWNAVKNMHHATNDLLKIFANRTSWQKDMRDIVEHTQEVKALTCYNGSFSKEQERFVEKLTEQLSDFVKQHETHT